LPSFSLEAIICFTLPSKADAVTVALPDPLTYAKSFKPASGKNRVFAMDFPHGRGVIKEESLVTPSAAVKNAINSLKPVIRLEFVTISRVKDYLGLQLRKA